MKKLIVLFALVVLIVAIPPLLLSQLNRPEARTFTGEKLESSRYEEITFSNDEQDISLAGMLFVPSGEGPFPAVVIIHGSGTSHRENRWYLSLTHYLQNSGVAVLLPDKRGSEKSEGNWRTASFEDLATDTLAAVQYLKSQEQVEVSRIGVIGMSQGGWIAPIVAKQSSDVDFLVSVVGTSVTSHEQLLYEENYNLRQAGFLPGVSNVVAYPATFIFRKFVQREFWDAIGNFDPLPWWEELTISALALYGQDDTNVPTDRSAALLRSLGKPNIRVEIYEGSGHALEDPVGKGKRIFREDALQEIRVFIAD